MKSPPENDSSFKQKQIKYKQVNLGSTISNTSNNNDTININQDSKKEKTEDIMLQKDDNTIHNLS